MAAISERHEVTVRGEERRFVFVAEPQEGRLVLREDDPDGEEVCALTLAEPEEIHAFFQGLRRVLEAADIDAGRRVEQDREPKAAALPPTDAEMSAGSRAAPMQSPRDGDDAVSEDRDEVVERARRKNPNAFKAWTEEEEQEVLAAHRRGEPLAAIARKHQRSQRAIEMRIKKLGDG